MRIREMVTITNTPSLFQNSITLKFEVPDSYPLPIFFGQSDARVHRPTVLPDSNGNLSRMLNTALKF